MKRFLFYSVFFLAFCHAPAQQGFRIGELNCENFFDPEDNPLKDDNQFLPTSSKRWSYRRYWNKLQNISKELTAMGRQQPLDFIALVEVENDSVMTHLTQKSILRRAGYKYLLTNSPDQRGINVGFLYQESTFKVINHYAIPIHFSDTTPFVTRDILYVNGITYSGANLHVFVCHFSSKLGGIKVSEPHRIQEAKTLREHIDSLFHITPNAHIVILGDFNETACETALKNELRAHTDFNEIRPTELYNLSCGTKFQDEIKGTYKYEERWEYIDQIIVSGNLLDKNSAFHTTTDGLHIFAPNFLLQWDDEYKDYKPFKTYNGYRYLGGFSDHLPIFLDFE